MLADRSFINAQKAAKFGVFSDFLLTAPEDEQ
jgi:hypothetical protein